MANAFHSFGLANVGAALATLRTTPAVTTEVITGLSLTNILGAAITASLVLIKSAGPTINLIAPNTPIPAGSSLWPEIGGKVVMEAGDVLRVAGSSANSLDASVSMMTQT